MPLKTKLKIDIDKSSHPELQRYFLNRPRDYENASGDLGHKLLWL